MADGHFQDVETLRRELAILVLEWAGRSVKDDPDGPMSTALTRAVGQAARDAVADQHQSLSAETADRIAEALDRRGRAQGLLVWRMRPWVAAAAALAAVALLAAAFLLGLQTGRAETPAPPEPTATAPVAPLAPAVDTPAPAAAPAPEPTRQPAVRVQKPSTRQTTAPPAKPPRELGRPAPTSAEAAPGSAQPVGAAAATPTPAQATAPR